MEKNLIKTLTEVHFMSLLNLNFYQIIVQLYVINCTVCNQQNIL